VTLQEPKNPPSADLDGPDTQVMIPPSTASPVFVDSTGRRRRLLRRASYAFGALCMLYGGLVSVSLAGGPVSPSAVLPLQALAEGGHAPEPDDALAQPNPMPEPTTTTAAPPKEFVSDQLPHGTPPVTHTLERAVAPKPAPAPAKPTKTSAPKSTPPSAPPSSRPVESATTTPPSNAPPPSIPSSPAPNSGAPAPKPPAAPGGSSAGTGGSGGGEAVAEAAPPTATPRVTPDPSGGPGTSSTGIESAIGSLLDRASPTCAPSAGGTEVAA
jgi:hypothetical protein